MRVVGTLPVEQTSKLDHLQGQGSPAEESVWFFCLLGNRRLQLQECGRDKFKDERPMIFDGKKKLTFSNTIYRVILDFGRL